VPPERKVKKGKKQPAVRLSVVRMGSLLIDTKPVHFPFVTPMAFIKFVSGKTGDLFC
jgi:hypothetical protein